MKTASSLCHPHATSRLCQQETPNSHQKVTDHCCRGELHKHICLSLAAKVLPSVHSCSTCSTGDARDSRKPIPQAGYFEVMCGRQVAGAARCGLLMSCSRPTAPAVDLFKWLRESAAACPASFRRDSHPCERHHPSGHQVAEYHAGLPNLYC